MKDWKAAVRTWETRQKEEQKPRTPDTMPIMEKDYDFSNMDDSFDLLSE